MEASANEYGFVWKKSENKYEARSEQKPEKLLPELCAQYAVTPGRIEELLSTPEEIAAFPFVSGLYTAGTEEKANRARDTAEVSGEMARYCKAPKRILRGFDSSEDASRQSANASLM